ncbi:MAG: NAD-glutamate dehydrogenase [Rhizomicrobium sp.]|jgi:glutamate dehydrogenase
MFDFGKSRRANPARTAALYSTDTATADTIVAGAGLLRGNEHGLQTFFEAFYHGASPEDVKRYAPESLAALASLVYAQTASRKSDETLIAFFDFHAQGPVSVFNETVLVAVNDDMPFLFDSLLGEMNAQGVRVHALFHPIMTVKRDRNGLRSDRGVAAQESIIALALDPSMDEAERARLAEGARSVFSQVRLAVRDWKKMMSQLKDSIANLKAYPPPLSSEELKESLALLEWLGDNHFTFLGCRDYAFVDRDGGQLEPVNETGLGVLSDVGARVLSKSEDGGIFAPDVRAFLAQQEPIIISKSNQRSVVHRRVHMDYVGVKMFNAQRKLTGERRFVGLLTSGAYSRRPSDVPLLRLKVERVISRAGLLPDSHDGKALSHILESYPRDELFQLSEDELFTIAMGILRLGERPKVRVFPRFDRFDRFVSVLVYVPRDRYDTQAREKIHAILAKAYNARMTAATPTLDETTLARVHYIIGRNEGPRPEVDVAVLESDIREAIRTWEDGFSEALLRQHGEAEGLRFVRRYAKAFPIRYRDVFTADEAVRDLDELLGVVGASTAGGSRAAIEARVYRSQLDARSALRLKVYVLGTVLPLSASLPVFENLGFRVIAEDSYPVSLDGGDGRRDEAAILDFQMERADNGTVTLEDIKVPLEEAFHAVISGAAENDGFNKLIVGAGLAWRDVTILRMAAKYLRQAGTAFSQDYMEQALARNPDIAALIVELFHVRNDPDQGERNAKVETGRARIEAALNDVPSLDDDRIIRRLCNVVECTLRTNFFQRHAGNAPPSCVAIKLDSRKLDELPAPRPLVEIFTYSPQVEGVHLRFGRVARGGIRWSDRREDFRTEILGLVKAQQVKNAVIVPVGAKGGFYPKQLPANATREAVLTAGIEAYKTFINALLDLTDNILPDGTVSPPERVVRHDQDDPYFVVAADKGTATFSDIANGIAEERGFWLGDAFASGGSHGYDHKKMGITAKGAWEAVKRHFRELGRDVQNEDFTCVGVGDMSGDVFGNGMLLSQHTKLLAAFDHRHIFVDPDPVPLKSWNERARLFQLSRSSWADYDKSLISQGGGVFERAAKEIPLSHEIKSLTGLTADKASPAELIRSLLRAEVDLLWFGGIGTYVKSSEQSNLEVGDRTNDALRVDGRDVRARVIAEGANLGATQLGRVEYALNGGRLNTDAIDNSAGVDTSDHEVNLKILLSGPLRRGELTPETRDELLNDMTDDVADHVLCDNYDQTLALSVALARAAADLDSHGRFIRDLERRGKLDRSVEFLPSDEELRDRMLAGHGLTRPELAVLLAYAKLDLDEELKGSSLPDQSYFLSELTRYFPRAAVERLPEELSRHRLKREIIATVLANKIVNLAGPTFVHRIKEISNASAARVAQAFVLAEGAFELSALRDRIDALDGHVSAAVQNGMNVDIVELLRRLGLWFLVNVPANVDLGECIARYRSGVESLRGTFSTLVSSYERHDTEARIHEMTKAGAPLDIAEDIAVLPLLGGAPEIVMLAHARSWPIDLIAGAYFAVGAEVGVDRLRGLALQIKGTEHWDRLAIRRIVDDLFAGQRALAADALALVKAHGTREDGAAAVKLWAETRADALTRTKGFLAELERSGDLSIAKLTLANSQIHELAAH